MRKAVLSKIGTAAIYAGHFVAGGLGFGSLIASVVKLIASLWSLFTLIWAHSASDQARVQSDLQQLADTAAALILLAVASAMLAKISEHSWSMYMLYGLVVGVLFAIGDFALIPASWTEYIFGPAGLSVAGGLVLGGFCLSLMRKAG